MNALSRRLTVSPHLQTHLQRLWKVIGSVSIRAKILGIVLSLTFMLGLGVTWQVRAMMSRTLVSELDNRGQSLINDLAVRSVDPILLNDTFALHELLADTLSNHPDVAYAFVLDPQGRVLAHTFENGFPTALLTINPIAPDDPVRQFDYTSDQGRIHDFAAPLFEGRSGVARVGLSETRLQTVINAVTSQMLFTTLAVALAGIVAASLLTWLLTRPVLELVSATQRVRQGDLSARAPHWADDEIGALADAFNQMVADLETSHQAVAEKEAARSRLLAQLINAQEEERRRIARNLHDSVGQSLTSLMVGLKFLRQLDDRRAIADKSTELRHIADETLDEVRLLSRQLRPSVLDDLGLAAALERYAAEFTGLYPNLTVDLHCHLPQRLPPPVETSLYRILQEAMTNAARHSHAKTLSVLLTARNNHAQAIVEDDGIGFDPEKARRAENSVGLHSMAERAELLGGALKIESSAKGASVYVEIPL